jgi:tetratricopeptide (TPR) repeat protein
MPVLWAAVMWGSAGFAHAQPRSGSPESRESMSHATTQERDIRDEQARRFFRLGRELYENGRFAEAAVEFERAYGLSGRGQLLYDAYIAYRDAQDDENAARTLRSYLESVPDVEDRVGLTARLEALERLIAERRAQDEAAARAARQAEEAERRAREAERRAAEAAAPRFREIPGEVWPWAILAAGGAMIAAGAITGAVALAERSSLDASCPLQLCPVGFDARGRQSAIETLAVATDVLLIAGGVTALTGLVLGIALGPRTEPLSQGAPKVGAACATDGCVAVVRGEM